jgi:hypothetical protein
VVGAVVVDEFSGIVGGSDVMRDDVVGPVVNGAVVEVVVSSVVVVIPVVVSGTGLHPSPQQMFG